MMRLNAWHGVVGAGVAAVCGVVGGCSGYHPSEYAGDGMMYALPNSKPRYDVELGPISLSSPGRAEYRLDVLPSENLLGLITVDEPSAEKQAWIEDSLVRVTMTLTDSDTGRVSTKSGLLAGEWSKSAQSWNGEMAEFEGIWFKPSRHSRHTLVVEVTVEHPRADAPAIGATVHVRGGGFGTY